MKKQLQFVFIETSQGASFIGIFCTIAWRAAVLNCILIIFGGEFTIKIILYSRVSLRSSFLTDIIHEYSLNGLVKWAFKTILFYFGSNFSITL